MNLIFLICIIFSVSLADDEIWEKDFTDEMKIGISTTGYQSVDLKCGADSFLVNVTLDADFSGVLYTRGDFGLKRKPCFLKSKDVFQTSGETALYKMKIPFTACHTVEDASDEEFVNVLVVQHDDELIMPGDAAFRLSCAFSPEQKLGTSIVAAPSHKSRIVLVDADPASKTVSKLEAQSTTDQVSFPKKQQLPPKEEL